MAFDTGSPIGSTDARDLYDNAQNLDYAVNQSAARWTDRLGVSRPSWAGMVAYADLGAYAAGMVITGYNEMFLFDGEYYRAAAATVLPYTTTGSWSDDGVDFVSIGDAALRSDLIEKPNEVLPIYNGMINVLYFGTLEEARTNSEAAGRTIVVDVPLTEAQSNILSAWPADRALKVEKGGSINPTTAFAGLPESTPEMFGAIGDGLINDTDAIQMAVTAAQGGTLVLKGSYYIDTDITGAEQLKSVINNGATFTNYSFKKAFNDELFVKANNQLKGLFRQRLTTSGGYPSVVITGDSLSYNHQDFDTTSRANATDCYPGMNSWAFMLRDAMIRDDASFAHGDELQYLMGTGTSNLKSNGQSQFITPFNGRTNVFRATAQAQTINIYYKHFGPQNKAYLWLLKNPLDTGCSFKVLVNGAEQVVSWDTGGTTTSDPYQGRELHFLEIPNVANNGLWHTITLTNFIGTASVPHTTNRDVYLCGISSRISNIKLTGMGSQSSKWLVDNLVTKVTTYSPDLSVIIIGANDGWAGNPQGLQTVAQYQANLNTIIDGIRAAKSTAQVLLLSPIQSSGVVVPIATMQRYIDKAREVAHLKGVAFLDVADFFSMTSPTIYRFDTIHMSKQGNEMLVRKLADMILPSASRIEGYLTASFSVGLYPYKYPEPQPERAYIAYSSPNFTVSRLSATDPNFTPVTSVSKVNDYTIRVNFAVDTSLYSKIDVAQFDANGLQKITVMPQSYFSDYILFQLRKQDGSQLVLADWTTYASSLKFIIECK